MHSDFLNGHILWDGGRGRGRGCEKPICHLDFATTEVPDLFVLDLAWACRI